MKINHIYLFTILIFAITSCDKLWFCEDEKLTMPQTEYNGSLKINGYYYNKYDSGYELYIFYNNGVVTHGRYTGNSLSEIENTFLLDEDSQEFTQSSKTKWGLFRITNSTITIQGWRISRCKRPVVEFRGEILTDTSLNINTYIDENDETHTLDESIYYFKSLSPKPDSTNDFIN